MRGENVLKKCCYRSLGENRKRTGVTIVGILLATALITGVACMVVSFRKSMIAYEKQRNGDFHYHFQGVAQEYLKYFRENQYIEKYGLTAEVGYAYLEGSRNEDKPYLYITAIEDGMETTLALTLSEGRMPGTDSELVVGRHVRSNGLVDVKVGDVLTLQVGKRMSEGDQLTQETPYLREEEHLEPAFEKEYTVVGILERPNQELEPRTAPGYSAFTLLEHPEAAVTADVYVSYTKKGLRQRDAVTAGILGVDEELYHRYCNGASFTEGERRQIRTVAKNVLENYWMLKWELLIFSSNTMNMLYGMSAIAIAIIIVTSVFCIHNSFMISLTEKMKLYGMLASVGTTRRQQKKIVYYEAVLLGVAGVPLGILGGILATAVLVRAVGNLVEEALGFQLIFGISGWAILLGAALSAATVYLSASGSARRAARLSPISSIRSNDLVNTKKRRSGKKLRCPAVIDRIFGIGGKIAYKNLRRARVKYRTTVISIAVSVAAFIGLTTFVELMMYSSSYYYEDIPYQLRASIYQWDFYDEALEIAALEGVEEAEVTRSARFLIESSLISYSEKFKEGHAAIPEALMLRCLGEEAYARYCRKVGVSVEKARDKAIVVADFSWEYWKDGKLYSGEDDIATFRPGEILRGKDTAEGLELEVLTQTKVKPMHMTGRAANQIMLIVSDEWMDTHVRDNMKYNDIYYDNVEVYVKCNNPDEIEQCIRNNMQLQHFTVTNYMAQYRSDRSLYLVVAIFLYGFITVVALIGITNIFNTVTTNMELRAPEFAMLRSVGMTGKEFRRMIWLEGVFYGGKALLIGVPVGIGLSAAFHLALGQGIVTSFRFPWSGTMGAVLAVAMLLFLIMHYSMGRIRRKNLVETIRNENI